MAETENIVIGHLRHIRGAVDALRDDMREVKGRLGILDSHTQIFPRAWTGWTDGWSGSNIVSILRKPDWRVARLIGP